MDIEKKPLGYISLTNNKQKPVYPMDDFFINYVFFKKDNWENLRTIINTYLDAYAALYNRRDGFHHVDEKILVETQYEHYLKNTTIQLAQDIKIDEVKNDDQTYIEFQNKMYSKPPVFIRASNYSGLAINKTKNNSQLSQIWFLAENADDVLCGQAISNFRTREDNTSIYYPREINTMFISLQRLALENNICGELSRVLLGEEVSGISDEVRSIANMFKTEYDTFKKNEEVVKSMTILDRYREESLEEGILIGEAKAEEKFNAKLENIILTKIKNNESSLLIKNFAKDIGISIARVDELFKVHGSQQPPSLPKTFNNRAEL